MTAPGQPGYQGQPYVYRSPWYLARLCLLVSMILFFLAAITAGGASVLGAPDWEWGFAGFAAWVAAGALP